MEKKSNQTLSEKIADFVLKTNYNSIPQSVINFSKTVLMDVFGVALTCVDLDHAKAIRKTMEELSSTGCCTLWATDMKADLANAAMHNSCLIHGADYDDTLHEIQ